MEWKYAGLVPDLLTRQFEKNRPVLESVSSHLISCIGRGGQLLVAGSGHSALFAMELYHRAGGPSFVLPVVDASVLPVFGPLRARKAERKPEGLLKSLDKFAPRPGEMLWICSQSGINAAIVELAIHARAQGLETVAFTSLEHSRASLSRHESGKRLFEVSDHVIDLGGVSGDALLKVEGAPRSVSVGPFSTISAVFLAHVVLSEVCTQLEAEGRPCVYTSVNTPDGERQNAALEREAALRDGALLAE